MIGWMVAFLVAGVLEVALQQRLYRAARARDPQRYEPEYEWAERVRARPSSLFRETFRASRMGWSVLLRRSPHPEVENLRRVTLVVVIVTWALFAMVWVSAISRQAANSV
jgi:hypothetical protein